MSEPLDFKSDCTVKRSYVSHNTSCCGYDAENRQDKESKKKQRAALSSSTTSATQKAAAQPPSPWKRRAPFNFTACLAHADITYEEETHAILRVMGYPHHNGDCKASSLVRRPAIPLHPHVYEIALKQLSSGAE